MGRGLSLQNEDLYDAPSGALTQTRFVPRVNFYVDDGKATPPAVAPAVKLLARKAVPESAKRVRD